MDKFKLLVRGVRLGSRRVYGPVMLMLVAVLLTIFISLPAAAASLITAPTAGETLGIGNTYVIKWDYTGTIGLTSGVDLAFSTDSGTTWTPIAENVSAAVGTIPTPQQYSWTVPNQPTTHARIRVTVNYTTLGGTFPNLVPITIVGATEETGDFKIANVILLPVFLAAPTDLNATTSSDSEIDLTWTDNTNNETAYNIERKTGSGSFASIATLAANTVSYADTGLASGTTYTYRVKAVGNGSNIHDSVYSNEDSATTSGAVVPPTLSTLLRFFLGSTNYYINDEIQLMDTFPLALNERILLPIRYVATPLGAVVDYNQVDQKVTVSLKGTIIEMWIGQSMAKVNGVSVAIDPANPDVTPVAVPPGRTMLPLRFIAENLNCKVDWTQQLQMVTVTYPKI